MKDVKDISEWFNLGVTEVARVTVEPTKGKLRIVLHFKEGAKHDMVVKMINKIPNEERLRILLQYDLYMRFPDETVMEKFVKD